MERKSNPIPYDRLEGLVYWAIGSVVLGVSHLYCYLGKLSMMPGMEGHVTAVLRWPIYVYGASFVIFIAGFRLFPKETDRKYLRLMYILLLIQGIFFLMAILALRGIYDLGSSR